MSDRINLLVVEDDADTCFEYENYCKELDDVFLIGTSAHSDEAVKITEEFLPNVVVLDLELQKGSGSGMKYLIDINKSMIKVHPYILVVTNNVSSYTQAVVRKFGADYIIVKSQSDYSVQMVIDFLRSILRSIPDMNPHTETCSPEIKQRIEDEYNRRLQQSITQELNMVGISPRAVGRDYLRDAIEMICHKKQTYISSAIAKKYQKTDASVERAMQNAINSAWRKTDIDTLERSYTAPISSEKGVPTLTEFIYYYADKVKSNM